MDEKSTPSQSLSGISEEDLYEICAGELDTIARTWRATKNGLRESMLDSVERNLALYGELSERRDGIIKRIASDYPAAAARLETNKQYKVLLSTKSITGNDNIILTYEYEPVGEKYASFPTHEAIQLPGNPSGIAGRHVKSSNINFPADLV